MNEKALKELLMHFESEAVHSWIPADRPANKEDLRAVVMAVKNLILALYGYK